MRFTLLASKDWNQRPAGDWIVRLAIEFGGHFGSSDIEDRWQQVDEVTGLLRDGTLLRRQTLRPVRDERRRDATFVLVLFVPPKRCVARVSPTNVVAPVRLRVPWLQILPSCAFEGTGSVVGTQKDQRVLVDAFVFQVLNQPADVLINAIDHRREDLHTTGFPLRFLSRELRPFGNVVRSPAELACVRVQQPHFDLLCEPTLAHRIPTVVESTGVLFHILLFRLERIVRSVEGDVREEWLFCVECFIDELRRPVDIGIGGVKVVAKVRPWFTVQTKRVVAGEEVGCPREVPPVPHEATIRWLTLQVPLSGHDREIAGGPHGLRDGKGSAKLLVARLFAVLPCQQTDPGGMALRRVVKLSKPQTATR